MSDEAEEVTPKELEAEKRHVRELRRVKAVLAKAIEQVDIAILTGGTLRIAMLQQADDHLYNVRKELEPLIGELRERRKCEDCGGETHDIPSVGGKLAAECNTCNHVQDRY